MNKKVSNNYIDFIGIGAQKAGTTWLYQRLNELSEFSLPYIKELHYFDRSKKYPSSNALSEELLINRLKNIDWIVHAIKSISKKMYWNDFKKSKWLFKWLFSNYNDDWYLSLFKPLTGITGDITPSYSILSENDVKKMHKLLPDVKLIFLLRNPIHRAWSHFRFHLTQLNLKTEDFDTKEIIDFFNNETQELRSDYLQTLETYSRYYSKKQILICFYDAIEEKPLELLSEIVNFLGGDSSKIVNECNLQARNNVSRPILMPEEINDFLKEKYSLKIKELADYLGSYCTKWYNETYINNYTINITDSTKHFKSSILLEK